MTKKEVFELLDKYYEAETTLEEESALQEYFSKADIPAELKPFQSAFSWQTVLRNDVTLSSSNPAHRRGLRVHWKRWVSVAAGLALAVSAFFMMEETLAAEKQTAIDWSQYEPETPEEAFRLTRKALMIASKGLNQGVVEIDLKDTESPF